MRFPPALRRLHGGAWDREWDDIVKEKDTSGGFCAKKPWELLRDRSLRWQLLTILLLNSAQQLNGINAVRRWAVGGRVGLAASPLRLRPPLRPPVIWGFFPFFFFRFTSTQVTCSKNRASPLRGSPT